jgi:predicted glycosyltransferase
MSDMASNLPAILVICGDPGGASAVAPVIKKLEAEKGIRVLSFAYNETTTIWDAFNIAYTRLPINFSSNHIKKLINSNPEIKLVFTGTSVNSIDLEREFIAVAAQLGIPSLSLIDFWTNYTRRFSQDGSHLTHLPDKIAIMDEYAFNEMISEGFDPQKLVITGQPAFDDLAEWRAGFSYTRRVQIRKELGLEPAALFVLFASQPLTSLYGTDVIQEKYLGFDEWTVLSTLMQTLEEIKLESEAKIHLVIRPHPRESIDLFHNYKSEIIPVTIVERGTARSQVMAADLVIGMNTELLVEACYLGCITVSLQPGLRHPDRLPTNRLGFSRAVYQHNEIKPVLKEMLLDEEARLGMQEKVKEFRLKGNSADNVVRCIFEMINYSTGSEERS